MYVIQKLGLVSFRLLRTKKENIFHASFYFLAAKLALSVLTFFSSLTQTSGFSFILQSQG